MKPDNNNDAASAAEARPVGTRGSIERDHRPSWVGERERKSGKRATAKEETFRVRINLGIGLYREIQYIANQEGWTIVKTISYLCRSGIKAWRMAVPASANSEE